jgi:aminoglycoside 3-N-acetyltransferase
MEPSKYYTEREKQPLYENEGKKIYYSDIVKSLQEAGIKKGDTVFVHSKVSAFGKLLTFDRDFLLGSLTDTIKEAVGREGTIIMPTFTYCLDEGETYDVDNSKSTVGVLTEFFRKQNDVIRTTHPNHSVAIWGRNKDKLFDVSKDTFNENSIFGRLHKINGKIVFLGAPFQSCTFIHYIEQMHKVPYRRMKTFRGKVIKDKKSYDEEISFYNKYGVFFSSFLRLEYYLMDKRLMKNVTLGAGKILTIDSKDLFDEGCKLLDKDIFYFLKNDPLIFGLFNKLSYPFLKYFPMPIKILDKIASKFLLR